MFDFLVKTKRFLWMFVELAFVLVLAIVLIHLILGESSGVFVLSVVDNITNFASEIPSPSLVGIAIILVLIFVIRPRLK